MSALAAESTPTDGEFPFTTGDFRAIADLLYKASGIHLADAKATLVYSRIAKRVRKLGLDSFKSYCDLLRSDPDHPEHAAMLSALTTNVTRFYREPHHFEHMAAELLPPLIARARAGGRVRLWSAGCSAGHEPYSMAMTLLEAFPDAARYDVRILATDIDPLVVDHARRGVYNSGDVEPIAANLRSKFLTREPAGGWKVAPALAEIISFGVINLMETWPMKGKFDAIFCRNVAIYFDEPTQTRLFTRFAQHLAPDGRLYIGHSERSLIPELVSAGLTIYRLKDKS
ncbi:MAG: protein-glutamate O-methyltransferase [Brevundimonas sp.]|uniref:CheR family methyltransferase n=1 Tax=Brevundimonas sp. TaxID=1871086 RepID=UPI0027343E5A|nr:protein-glutamate O-methyltransferase [Brevundimonas sp.]MDP3406372.1 protein-glutamate O-methyltransferase [Brevundimonas sp.]